MKLTKILIGFLGLQSLLLLFLFSESRVLDKMLLRADSGRMNPLMDAYKRNPAYSQYISLFERYRTGKVDIVIVGDSMVSIPDWEALINLDVEMLNYGIPGDTLAGVNARGTLLEQLKPDCVIYWIGINDVLRGYSDEHMQKELHRLAKHAGALDSSVVMIGLAPIHRSWVDYRDSNDTVRRFNEKLAEMCEQYGFRYVEVSQILGDDSDGLDSAYTVDGLHLNGAGYEQLVTRLKPVILECLDNENF